MKELLVRPTRPGLKKYSTGLWDTSHGPVAPFFGRGWAMGFRYYQHEGDRLENELQKLTTRLGFSPQALVGENRDLHARWQSIPELLIFAPDRTIAQRAANLLFAAMLALEGQSLVHTSFIAVPEDKRERRSYDGVELDRDVPYAFQPGVAKAAALSARLSTKKRWQYAAMKYWASHMMCSVPFIETDPWLGTHLGIERDPVNHVRLAQALTSAYSVLEEIGLELRASRENPSTIDGQWNPRVREELEGRLRSGGIDLDNDEVWMVRGSPTRLERKRAHAEGLRPSWARANTRDRHIAIVDAIARASWLRSKVSAHRLSELSASLTALDVVNVQLLARRLLLEQTGFLPGRPSARTGHRGS
ncbi:MAG TPA: hypothetical protein VGG11_22865 [Xanthobacteraceae bacterium]|jgi:hypothetical protein